jgi:carbon storage regulator
MLVVSRKASESLLIGADIRITVTQIGKGRVRLGIDAPKHVHVRRSELPELEGPATPRIADLVEPQLISP